MIVVRLQGGLGNQMFEYAFAKGMADRLNVKFKLDCTWILDKNRGDTSIFRDYSLDVFKFKSRHILNPNLLRIIYRIPEKKLGSLLREVIDKRFVIYNEKQFGTDQDLLINSKDGVLYTGHWQNLDYFKNVEIELRKDFQFRMPLLPNSISLLEEIRTSQSVCINVRRAEYLKIKLLNTTGLDYFNRSVDILSKEIKNPKIFVFSEDLGWCRENFNFPFPTTYVSHEHDGYKYGNYMRLMAACKHFIIPNSTYAWWAAWLGQYEDKIVIAPDIWFNDTTRLHASGLIPKDWIRI